MTPEVAQLRGTRYFLFTIGAIATCSLPMVILLLLDRKAVAEIGISPLLRPSALGFILLPAAIAVLLNWVFSGWRDPRDGRSFDEIDKYFS